MAVFDALKFSRDIDRTDIAKFQPLAPPTLQIRVNYKWHALSFQAAVHIWAPLRFFHYVPGAVFLAVYGYFLGLFPLIPKEKAINTQTMEQKATYLPFPYPPSRFCCFPVLTKFMGYEHRNTSKSTYLFRKPTIFHMQNQSKSVRYIWVSCYILLGWSQESRALQTPYTSPLKTWSALLPAIK